ncbi:MAG: bifunctional UDP-N-acetylglucosamine diphosphorylase/glucosamine-1-phosphate N-acetyltransferase GlmU [bacterium]|nr:bifunctional UDP-N-acetylglucosamine diphosphorylase/glucosamine-1-phosphate N-acetyltransferase GlmU [bacterium]
MINAIVLAAGKGTRMKTDLPKCAFPILEKPMINYIMDALDKTKVEKRIVVVGYKKEVFYDLLKNNCVFATQENQLGTADAVKAALNYLDDGITLIIPGDTPLINYEKINSLIETELALKKDITILTTFLDNPTGYGRIIRENGKIVRIAEEKDAYEDEKLIKEVNTGIMVVDNKFLKEAIHKIDNNNFKKEYYLTDLLKFTTDIASIILDDNDILYGINDLYALSRVEDMVRRNILKKHMLNGVNIINPESVTIYPDVVIEDGVTILQGSFISGNTIIKKGAIIGPNSELHNANVLENAKVKHSVVYDSRIGKGATVGPFAHIRMNAIIGEGNRIGNFVEVKNSILGTTTKASHLSYLGDSEIGNNVNIGCGSITVNYDGKKKSKTVIGNNVFVGCNSNLIAPIEIKDNAFIAAGSTITDNVDDNDLAIARSRQINKKGYAKKYK